MTIRETIKQKNREFSEDEYLRKQMCREVFTQDATERKIRAAEYFAPILKDKFGEKYPLLDWEEESVNLAMLCYYGPDDLNQDIPIVPAIAIFTADSIFRSEEGEEKLRNIKTLMDEETVFDRVNEDVEDSYYKYCEIDAVHPFYPPSLIEDLESYIAFRDVDFINYSKTKSVKYKSYSFVCSSYTASLKKEKKESEIRKIFDSIMDLIPGKDKDEAIEEYRKLFFALIDCYLETRENIKKGKKKLEGRMENLKYSLQEELTADKEQPDKERSIDCINRIQDIGHELDRLDFISNNLNDNYAMGLYSTTSFIDKYTRPFGNIPPFDPYKVIAGYFFLLESGDNYAWLLGSSLAPVGFAGYRLPWTDMTTTEDVRNELSKKLNKHYWDNDDIYLPTIRKESIGIEDDYIPDKISIAKAVYILTDTVPPRFNIEVPQTEDLRNELGDEMYRKFENFLNFTYTTKNKLDDTSKLSSWLEDIKDHNALTNELDAVKSRLNAVESEKDELEKKASLPPDIHLLEEIESLKDKLETLNSALIKEEAGKEKMRREFEREKREHRSREEELYSLRELLFTRDDDKKEKDEAAVDPGIQYPYRTELDIIVIGGLPDWLKAMKNLLPDVKFFGDRAPQKEVLKHSDIVWFQTYAGLSHKTFYKAVDDIKAFDIPIKYCPTSGVYRSASAIVRDEEKRRRE